MSYLLAALGFIVLIVLHEAGHFTAAKAVGMRVERFSLFFGPLLIRKRIGETDYGIGPIPLGGYVKITGMNPYEELSPEVERRAYYRQPVWKRVVVILAGPVVNLVLALVILTGYFLSQGEAVTNAHGDPVVTTKVAPGSLIAPASHFLRAGDRIISVDGRGGSAAIIRRQIGRHRCPGVQRDGCVAATPAHVVVVRDGRRRAFDIRPRYSTAARRPLLGFGFDARTKPVGAVRAVVLAGKGMGNVTTRTLGVFAHIFVPRDRKQVSSVVGGYEATQQSFAQDTSQAWLVLGIISLSLGLINLFPFLPLDGGHIFWALAEKVRGRPIPFSVLERASAVGFLLVLMIFAIGLTNDIGRLGSGGFGSR
jgi:regulator of sigma E protease